MEDSMTPVFVYRHGQHYKVRGLDDIQPKGEYRLIASLEAPVWLELLLNNPEDREKMIEEVTHETQ